MSLKAGGGRLVPGNLSGDGPSPPLRWPRVPRLAPVPACRPAKIKDPLFNIRKSAALLRDAATSFSVRLHKAGCFELLPEIQASVDSRGCLVIKANHLGPPIATNDIVEIIDKNNEIGSDGK